MINPKNDHFIWGPLDGRPVYVSYFMIAQADGLPKYGKRWPEILFYFFKNRMTFISDNKDLIDAGKKHFNKWMLNDGNFLKAKGIYLSALKKLNECQVEIGSADLPGFSDKELYKLYRKWHFAYVDFWGIGLVPEIANFGGEAMLKEQLAGLIVDKKEYILALEKLSAPEKLSFYQEEELELLRLKKNFSEHKLNEHANKYYWIRNSYYRQRILDKKYFLDVADEVSDVDKRISKIENYASNIIKEKKRIIKKYQLKKAVQKISSRLSYSIWWQDARKKQIFRANHYIDIFLNEFSRRFNIRMANLQHYFPDEFFTLILQRKKIPDKVISDRKKFVNFHKTIGLTYRSGKDELKKIKPFLTIKIMDDDVIKGTVVSVGKGIISGKARILLTPRFVSRMQKGEILVAPMTSPDYIFAMRKAAAVVTDEGGMTSHAAIVSRELNIPCIVGTKIATKVIKGGDIVEVNANHGIVKILERK